MCEKPGMNKDKGMELSAVWKDIAEKEYKKHRVNCHFFLEKPDEDYHSVIETSFVQMLNLVRKGRISLLLLLSEPRLERFLCQ